MTTRRSTTSHIWSGVESPFGGIVERVEDRGLSPEAVADEYDLALADVYRALTYYYDHPDEMAAVERRRAERERAAREDGAETLDEIRDRTG